MPLSDRFDEAFAYAADLHRQQLRKGTAVPYIAHLMAVTALVLEAGGDEDQAIAALLHDAVEDQGGLETLAEIRRRFGERVAHIVEGCSDTNTHPKPPWRDRKQEYLAHLRQADGEVLLVSLADKVHNARSILRDLKQNGDRTWQRFNGGKQGTIWYYHNLAQIFAERSHGPLVDELQRVVGEMESLAALKS